MPMEKSQFEQLEWLLEFAYADLDSFNKQERTKVAILLAAMIEGYDPEPYEFMEAYMLIKPSNDSDRIPKPAKYLKSPETVKKIQDRFRAFTESIFDRMASAKAIGDEWMDEDEFEKSLVLGSFKTSIEHELTIDGGYSSSIIYSGVNSAEEIDGLTDEDHALAEHVARWNPKKSRNSKFRVTTFATNDLDTLKQRFLENIDGIPLYRIGRCHNCSRWFVMKTEKERKYCSRQCSQNFLSRKSYQKKKDSKPDKYEHDLENKRHYMHDRYVKQTESETGAKVKPRPIKRRPKKEDK